MTSVELRVATKQRDVASEDSGLLSEAVARAVASAPPLTNEQKDTLAAVFSGVAIYRGASDA